jgi:hypothetical protein
MVNRKTYFLHTRNKRHTKSHKSRRISKRSRSSFYKHHSRKNKQRGGGYEYHIPDEAVVGYKTDEGVEVFKTMSEIRKEKENGPV